MSRFKRACEKYGVSVVKALLDDKDGTARHGLTDDVKSSMLVYQAGQDKKFRKRLNKDRLISADYETYITPLFKAFGNMTDPSAERASRWKYLDWACRVYLQSRETDDPIKAEDLYKIKSDLEDFEAFQQRLSVEQRDINFYSDHQAFLETLRPHQQKRDEKKAADLKASVKVLDESTIVYNGPEGHIVVPHTHEACRFWGQQTRWCITAESDDHFNNYNKKHPIYIYMPRPSKLEKNGLPEFSSFKFCGVNDNLYDERDHSIDYSIPCLQKLFNAAVKNIEVTENKRHLFKHGSFSHLKPCLPETQELWADKDELLKTMKMWPLAYNFATAGLKKDPDCIKAALKKKRDLYKYVPPEAFDDPAVSKAAYKSMATCQTTQKLQTCFNYASIPILAAGSIGATIFGAYMGADSIDSTLFGIMGFMGGTLGTLGTLAVAEVMLPRMASLYISLPPKPGHEARKEQLKQNIEQFLSDTPAR